MRCALIVLWMLLGPVSAAYAQVSIGIGLPGVSIGINLPVYPELVRVPGYPVYYAPQVNSNFFFYDGLYWVYQSDNWYASSWYNGPWGLVGPEVVPLYVLRIPVRYYRDPPGYFRGWRTDAPPRWGDYWGNDWQQRRSGWDRWNRNAVPAPAPLPAYQRQFSGNRYPQQEQQQRDLHGQNYRYQPRDAVVREHYREREQRAPAPSQRGQQGAQQERSTRPQEVQRPNPPQQQQGAPAQPRSQPPQRGEDVQRSAPAQAPAQQRGPSMQEQSQPPRQAPAQREQQAPRSNQESAPQGKGASQEERRGQGQDKGRDRDKGDERGQDRNR